MEQNSPAVGAPVEPTIRPLVAKLRERTQAVAWRRGQDTDYPTKWEPDALCQQAADEIETLRTQLAHWKVFAEHAEGERSQMSADAARLDRFEEWLADSAGPLLHIDDVRNALDGAAPRGKGATMTTEATPREVGSHAGLGLVPERDARWAEAAEVARGRMAGGWVPVDADLVLALHARLTKLAALEQQVAEGEELDKYRRGDGKREWSDACTWLYPGDRVVVLRA